ARRTPADVLDHRVRKLRVDSTHTSSERGRAHYLPLDGSDEVSRSDVALDVYPRIHSSKDAHLEVEGRLLVLVILNGDADCLANLGVGGGMHAHDGVPVRVIAGLHARPEPRMSDRGPHLQAPSGPVAPEVKLRGTAVLLLCGRCRGAGLRGSGALASVHPWRRRPPFHPLVLPQSDGGFRHLRAWLERTRRNARTTGDLLAHPLYRLRRP